MSATVTSAVELPRVDGRWEQVALIEPQPWAPQPEGFTSRQVFAAAHVAADPWAPNVPGAPAVVDWDATLAFRRELFRYGFGVAEAMDTAQRNMGLDWPAVQDLVRRSAEQASAHGARIASGAGTDQASPGSLSSLDEVVAAYAEQIEFIESTGSQVILMASRHLPAVAASADDYAYVYDKLLSQVAAPVVLHWLGDAFDPQLRGYWGSTEVEVATAAFLQIVSAHAAQIDGVKVSLLSRDHEINLRAALPAGVRLYTGDDFNYPELIRGDATHYSDALLGAFAAIAPRAAAALRSLDADDLAGYDAAMAPTLPLSRHIFEAPTFHYKSGIAFLAWLNGHQPGFAMVGGMQSARGAMHLTTLFRLANDAQLLRDPELAARRMVAWLDVHGIAR